jgi:DMSO/TMAO reductase YedYZ heme-binding membrane subunit
MAVLVACSIIVILVLVMTKPGRDIDAATQRFMLFYAGVFALVGLTASVGVGLLATDRIVMAPGHRVMAQAVHRAVSFAALAFLVIHIVTEILAQRVHVIDAFIPFLAPYRTFYIGLGTIASDLILLVAVSSIIRKRFTAHGSAWRWRAIHCTSYVAFVLGVLHGLLGGREAKPYVDWSYGLAIAATALALVVRFLAISLRTKESLSGLPGADRAPRTAAESPLRAAALSMAQAQLGGAIQVLPAIAGMPGASGIMEGQGWITPPAESVRPSALGPFPALAGSPGYPAQSSYEAYREPAFIPLGAPAYPVGPPRSAWAGPGTQGRAVRQPRYEPGYDGPPRFEGAPRKHVPQDDVSSYPYGPQSHRQQPGPGYRQAERNSGPIPRLGPGPRADSGPIPRVDTGPIPRVDTGPIPRVNTGPMPRVEGGPARRAGPAPARGPGRTPPLRADSGLLPRTGSQPRPGSAAGQRAGATPRAGTRRSRGPDADLPRNREVPEPNGGDQWR